MTGILSDAFGVNGRRILDGLRDGLGRGAILDSLTRHVRTKMEDPGDAPTLEPGATDRFILDGLLEEHTTCRLHRVKEADTRIGKALAPWMDRIRLLTAIPGIDIASACAIFVGIGPDLGVFRSASRLAAWVGLCPGNNESGARRCVGRARKGNRYLRASPRARLSREPSSAPEHRAARSIPGHNGAARTANADRHGHPGKDRGGPRVRKRSSLARIPNHGERISQQRVREIHADAHHAVLRDRDHRP